MSRSLGRSFQTTRLLLKKQLWAWPLIACALLMVVGFLMHRAVDRSLRASIATQLETILAADVAALDEWMQADLSYAQFAAADPRVAAAACELIAEVEKEGTTQLTLAASPARQHLIEALRPWFDEHAFRGYVVFDLNHRIASADHDELIGKEEPPAVREGLDRVLAGKALVTPPFPSIILLTDEKGKIRTAVPTMFAAAPVRDEAGKIVGGLALRIAPEADFTRILNVARMGETGETYAFSREGKLLSQSRFDDQLKQIGLIPDHEDSHSIFNIEIRDPQVDMAAGQRPKLRRSEQPLTYMVSEAAAGRAGVDVSGYRDYRGVPVFGAWTWLDRYDFGIGTEVDVAEAARPGMILKWAFWGLFTLLALCSIAIFIFTIVVARLQQQARRAALSAKKLGQYALEEKIGAGGMGVVYRGRHAMLRRPTAIKLLDVEKTTEESIKRFEREVSITSQLNHPNTIAIYDFGRTPEGIFYYAMELLNGMDLERLVKSDGPQPEGRVIHILTQVCGSLGEAHMLGLIHRDIKPANIFLTERGGVPDFVKLLDFGLVKAVDQTRETQVTMSGSMTGTPLYMSPEAIQQPAAVDARSDLYALGAVGYFLITGTPPFRGDSLVKLCADQVSAKPEAPSARLGKPISGALEAILLGCLEKDPANRPQSAAALAAALRSCSTAGSWTDADAAAWWASRGHAAMNVTVAEATNAPTHDQTAIWTSN